MLSRRGVCLVVAGPSGAGKSAITRGLLATEPALSLSISATTRAIRPGEVEGQHYFFRTQHEFDAMIGEGAFIEYAHVFGRSYGTPRAPVEAALGEGRDVAFDIDWQGHLLLRAALPGDVISVFVLPPSLAALQERLSRRGQDGQAEIDRRMAAAQSEISHWGEFDHVLVNTDLQVAIEEVRAVLHAGRSATRRQLGMAGFVGTLV